METIGRTEILRDEKRKFCEKLSANRTRRREGEGRAMQH